MGTTVGRGYLIALEGIDGAGKTVNSKWLVRRLKEAGYNVVYTMEPTYGVIGVALRELQASGASSPEIDALLFAADRLYHVRHIIEPSLKKGYVVVTDRYLYSSIAYQGAMTGDRKWVELVNRYYVPPDLAIYLDVDPSTGLGRKRKGKWFWRWRSGLRAFEDPALLEKVRAVYLELCEEGKLVRVPADRELGEVRAEIAKVIWERLGIDIRSG
jgi:dTMP kinase